ncbi:MAG: cation:proton antiporter [bacterium]|nr:cation:proton antiporter [bacterium]
MTDALAIIFVGALVFLAHLFAALFSRTRIPDVLPLVLLGVLLGPVLKIVSAETFGQFGQIFTSIALVMILFESGIGLNFAEVHKSITLGIQLTLASFAATTIAIAVLASPLLKLPILECFILGAILGATAPAVVIPLIRQLRLQKATRVILLLETSIGEALCIVITLGLLQIYKYEELDTGKIIGQLISSFLLATTIGVIFAFLWSSILRHIRQLKNSIFLTPAFVFILYGTAEILGYSGALAALAFGIVLGNAHSIRLEFLKHRTSSRPVKLKEIEKAFFSEAVFLLKTFFFVYIGLSIKMNNLNLTFIGLAITSIIFVVRVPTVRILYDTTMQKFDAAISSIMVPRGMAAAVLASLPALLELENGLIIQEVIFAVILFSIVLTAAFSFIFETGKLPPPYRQLFSRYSREVNPAE